MLHLNGLMEPVRKVLIKFHFQQMLSRGLHRSSGQFPRKKALQIPRRENMAVKSDSYVSRLIDVGAAVITHDDLRPKALGPDEGGKPVEQRRCVGGYGTRFSGYQGLKLIVGQHAAVLVDHVVLLGLAFQRDPLWRTVVSPYPPLFPMTHTGQIFPYAPVVEIIEVNASDVIDSLRPGMGVRQQDILKTMLQNSQVALTAYVF